MSAAMATGVREADLLPAARGLAVNVAVASSVPVPVQRWPTWVPVFVLPL